MAQLNRFDRIAWSAVATALAAVFTYLFGYALLFTSVLEQSVQNPEHIITIADSVWRNLLMLLAGVALCRALLVLERLIPLRVLTGVALGVAFALGCAWVLLARAVPTDDAGILYYAASDLMRGDLAFLETHDVYLHTNPHQAGYLQYAELLQRVFGRRTYVPQGILNAAFLTAAYGAVLDVTWQSLRDRRIQLIAVVLLVTCLPLVLFCTFLYGNLPGLCLALWAVALVVRWMHGARASWLIAACALMCCAAVLKPNFRIFALALALVVGLYALSARQWRVLVLTACLLILPALAGKGAQLVLEKRTGASLGTGAPQTTWLAMGMQEGPLSSGWYNRYTLEVMEQNGCDTELVAAQVNRDIRERLSWFAAHPSEAVEFYHRKLVSQWAETTYESLYINQCMTTNSTCPELLDSMLYGAASKWLSGWMEGYALMMYLGFALGLVRLTCRLRMHKPCWRDSLGLMAFLITVLGGFLYHMLFEGKSQYLTIYVPLMAPFAAMGLSAPLRRKGNATVRS